MDGIHITADIYGCACDSEFLTSRNLLGVTLSQMVAKNRLTMVNEVWHTFRDVSGPGGVTGVVLLAESHLAVHTWPELASVTIDIYVCNFSEDNTDKARALAQDLMLLFRPSSCEVNEIGRGAIARKVAIPLLT